VPTGCASGDYVGTPGNAAGCALAGAQQAADQQRGQALSLIANVFTLGLYGSVESAFGPGSGPGERALGIVGLVPFVGEFGRGVGLATDAARGLQEARILEETASGVGQASNWVVRAGLAKTERLQAGFQEHLGAPGVFGFSVQYEPGRTIEELAAAGRFPNGQISYAADTALSDAARNLGYDLALIKTPGRGFHYTLGLRASATSDIVQQLPDDVAQAFEAVFQQRDNPFIVPR